MRSGASKKKLQHSERTADLQHAMAHPFDSQSPRPAVRPVRWVGGVLRPYGFKHAGKPMRLAAWMTSAGTLIDAAIVVRNGPTVLRAMLDEQLLIAEASRRPSEVVVWPGTKSAFRDLSFPSVTVRRDEFLRTVVEDLCDFGQLPHGAPARAW